MADLHEYTECSRDGIYYDNKNIIYLLMPLSHSDNRYNQIKAYNVKDPSKIVLLWDTTNTIPYAVDAYSQLMASPKYENIYFTAMTNSAVECYLLILNALKGTS